MVTRLLVAIALTRSAGLALGASSIDDDAELCRSHVISTCNTTWREPIGALKHQYLVPSGPYSTLWDWDSVFLGVATLKYGSRPYLAGSMMVRTG